MSGRVITVTCNPSIDKTITVEKLQPYGLNRVLSSRLDPGGKGINVAKVLKSFGADVSVTGFIAGRQGELLSDFLNKSEISFDFQEIPGETRTNIKLVDLSVNKTTEINESGCFVDSFALAQFREKFGQLMTQASIVVLSGSLPPGVPADFYAQCIHVARENGVKAILDADGEALIKGMEETPFAVKPNIQELEAFCGHRLSGTGEVVEAARELINRGVEIVIVSMGPDGAVVVDKDAAYKTDAWNIRVQSTVGAGDSMVGALASSILKGSSLYDIAKLTTASGTVTASKAGTEICTLREVLDSLSSVKVTNI